MHDAQFPREGQKKLEWVASLINMEVFLKTAELIPGGRFEDDMFFQNTLTYFFSVYIMIKRSEAENYSNQQTISQEVKRNANI